MTGIIYSATNKTNCMTYVGQTTQSLQKRKQQHIWHACNKNRCIFSDAIREYGEDNFLWDVIATYKHTDTQKLKSMLDKAEMYYINAYDTFHAGYNMTEGGDGQKIGWNPSKETRQRMSESHMSKKNGMYGRTGKNAPCFGRTGKKHPMYGRTGEKNGMYGRTGEKHPMYGKKRPGEKSGMYKKKHTEETKKILREANIGEKNPMYGKDPWNKGKTGVYTEETLKRKSEACKGEKHPMYEKKLKKETIQLLCEAHKGQVPWNKGMNKEEMALYRANNKLKR